MNFRLAAMLAAIGLTSCAGPDFYADCTKYGLVPESYAHRACFYDLQDDHRAKWAALSGAFRGAQTPPPVRGFYAAPSQSFHSPRVSPVYIPGEAWPSMNPGIPTLR